MIKSSTFFKVSYKAPSFLEPNNISDTDLDYIDNDDNNKHTCVFENNKHNDDNNKHTIQRKMRMSGKIINLIT